MGYVPGQCLTSALDLPEPTPRSYMLYGLPGAGKTTTAATVSKFWPLEGPWKTHLTEPCILKDMMWLEADKDGIIGLVALNIRPAVTFSLYEILRAPLEGETKVTAKDIDEALGWFYKELEHARDKLGIKWIVIDTISTLAAELEREYVHGPKCPRTKDEGKNTQGGWQAFGNAVTVLRRNLMMSGLKYMYLAHAKVNNAEVEAGKKEAWQRRDAKAPDGEVRAKALVTGTASFYNDIVPAIPGKSLEFINREVSLELWVEALDLPGKPTQYFVYPNGHNGAQGKNRFKEILGTVEPAHLGQMEDKIRKFTTPVTLNSKPKA